MAAFNKFTCFATDLGLKLHNLNTDQLNVYLTNHLPVAATDTVYSAPATGNTNGPDDIATAGSGYTAGGADTANTFSAGNCVGTDITWTADAATGPFQYAVLYNSSAAAKNLIGWWAYTAEVTLAVGETFKTDFGATMFTVV